MFGRVPKLWSPGSFASYMLSMDALDLAFSNLIQIVKMRTSAGFIPSYSAGTLKSRDRSNPPVTANILHKITQRWGAERTKWAVGLWAPEFGVCRIGFPPPEK